MPGCCCRDEKVGVPGIVRDRSPSDPLMFLLWACGWAAIIVMLIYAQDAGASFDRLTTPYDMDGVACGSGANADKPYGAWPHPVAFDFKICVADCSETSTDSNIHMAVNYKSQRVANWCVPDPSDDNVKQIGDSAYNSHFASASEAAMRSVSDLWVLRWVLLASIGGTIFVSLLIVILSRHCVKFFVWGSIVAFLGSGVVLGGVFWFRYRDEKDVATDEWKDAWFSLAIATWGVTFIAFLILFFLRKQIKIAIEVIREASRVIGSMPCLMFFPVVPALAM